MGHIGHHDHEHDHAHSHEQPVRPLSDSDKTKALLGYMVEHNEHHAEELADLLPSLDGAAAAKLQEAIGCFEAGNVQLRQVLEALDKQDN